MRDTAVQSFDSIDDLRFPLPLIPQVSPTIRGNK